MIFDILDCMPVGSVELLLTKTETDKKQFIFIKDTYKYLIQIGNAPIVETKCIVFEKKNCEALLFMIRFEKNDDLIYCRWFNYHNDNDKKKLQRLIFDKNVNFCLIDSDNKKYSSFEIENQLAFTVKNYIKVSEKKYWDEYSFKNLISNININYSNRISLFNETKYLEK